MADYRLISKSYPEINTQDVPDLYSRSNFQQLKNFFTKENQLVGFKHLSFSFSEATDNAKIPHGLGYLPQDVLVTRITGAGKLTLNWPSFDSTALDVSVSGPCEVRMYVGTYSTDQGNISSPLGASEVQAAVPSLTTPVVTEDGETAAVAIDWSLFPAGMWLEWSGPTSTIPTGWAERDGRTLSTTDYPALFAIVGYGWGGSGGSFRLPDTRGYFTRHLDTTVLGRDPDVASRTNLYTGGNTGAKVGTFEDDTFQDHVHTYFTNNAPPLNFSVGSHPPRTQDTGGINTTTGGQSGYKGGSETRGRNMAVIGIIKLK